MIELDLTFVYQMIGFFVLYFLLNALLYKPVIKILDARDKNIGGKRREAEALEAKLQKRLLEYENSIKDAKTKAQEERLSLRQEGIDKEREILESARKKAQESIMKAKAELDQNVKTIYTRLREENKMISKDIAEKIVGRKVG